MASASLLCMNQASSVVSEGPLACDGSKYAVVLASAWRCFKRAIF